MKNIYRIILSIILLLVVGACTKKQQTKAPIFVDPNYHGSCDPEIVWNESLQKYYIYYTSRRSQIQDNFVRTPLGVISSKDMISWDFEGYCSFDGIGGKKDADATFWAPAIISYQDTLHMFVTWKPDTTTEKGDWGGPPVIVHYKAPESNPIMGWQKVGIIHSETLTTIDATVYQKEGAFHVWFKGRELKANKNELYHKVTRDFKTWTDEGFSKSDVFNESVTGYSFEEAPYIFKWKGLDWLITDTHDGLLVYNSINSDHWHYQGKVLKESGTRAMDSSRARHCSVMVKDGRAFIFYHVEPWRLYKEDYPKGKYISVNKQPIKNRLSVLQMAELEYEDGQITCDRNKTVSLK